MSERNSEGAWSISGNAISIACIKTPIAPMSTAGWFSGERRESYYDDMTEIIGLDKVDTSLVTDMSHMFRGCSSLTSLDVSGFDTSNVTDMSHMFQSCINLTSLDVSGFDTSNVTDMSHMFDFCRKLTSLDVSSFDTSNVTDMSWMFNACRKLTSLDVSSFDTSNVTDMTFMFSLCSSLSSLDVSGFDTSKVTSMSYMFSDCISLASLDVSGFDTSKVRDMAGMFRGCQSLRVLDVSRFDTSNVEDMSEMFAIQTDPLIGKPNTALTSLNVSRFNTSRVTKMNHMFKGCESLMSLDVSSFDTSSVTEMEGVFEGCDSLSSLDVSGWDLSSVVTPANKIDGRLRAQYRKTHGAGRGTKRELSATNPTHYPNVPLFLRPLVTTPSTFPDKLPKESGEAKKAIDELYKQYDEMLSFAKKLRDECERMSIGDPSSPGWGYRLLVAAASSLGITNPKQARLLYDFAEKDVSETEEKLIDRLDKGRSKEQREEKIPYILLGVIFSILMVYNYVLALIAVIPLCLLVVLVDELLRPSSNSPDNVYKTMADDLRSLKFDINTEARFRTIDYEIGDSDQRSEVAELVYPFQQEEVAKLAPKDKYLANLDQQLENASLHSRTLEANRQIDRISYLGTLPIDAPKKQDPYFWGGVASAAGGPVLGMIEASRIQAKNEQEKRAYQEFVRNQSNQSEQLRRDQIEIDRAREKEAPAIAHLNEEASYIKSRRTYEGHTQELFSMLDISCDSINISKYGSRLLVVGLSAEVDPVYVKGSPAVLDGTLMINIVDETGRSIAQGLYCAPGYGEMNLSKVGFNVVNSFAVACRPTSEMPESTKNLKCEITPKILWAIEK